MSNDTNNINYGNIGNVSNSEVSTNTGVFNKSEISIKNNKFLDHSSTKIDVKNFSDIKSSFVNKSSSAQVTLEDVKKMFPEDKLPESDFSKRIWKCEDNKCDLNLDSKDFETSVKLMNSYGKDKEFWKEESGINCVSKGEMVTSFAKFINAKRVEMIDRENIDPKKEKPKESSKFYFDIAEGKYMPDGYKYGDTERKMEESRKEFGENGKALFNNIMHTTLNQITKDGLDDLMKYKNCSWKPNNCISNTNINFVKGTFENYDFDSKTYQTSIGSQEDQGKIKEEQEKFLRSVNDPWDRLELNEEDRKQVGNLTESLIGCSFENDVLLFRGESSRGVINLAKTAKWGERLHIGEEIENYMKKNPEAGSKEISNFAKEKLVGKYIEQDRFMSTTCNYDFAENWARADEGNKGIENEENPPFCVVWEIMAKKGTKGVFIETLREAKEFNSDEHEFLLQRSSLLNVIGVDFRKCEPLKDLENKGKKPANCVLKIRAELKQMDPKEILSVKYSEEIEKEIKELKVEHYNNVSKLKDLKMDEKTFKEEEMKLRERMSDILTAHNFVDDIIGEALEKIG